MHIELELEHSLSNTTHGKNVGPNGEKLKLKIKKIKIKNSFIP
jgi:hypothetical protein